MQKLIAASFILVILAVLQTSAFASTTLDCKFKSASVIGVKSIQLSEESLFINKDLEIPLEKSRVKCGNFGKQVRFDGHALGYQVVLKSCTADAILEGHLIDSVNEVAAEVACSNK